MCKRCCVLVSRYPSPQVIGAGECFWQVLLDGFVFPFHLLICCSGTGLRTAWRSSCPECVTVAVEIRCFNFSACTVALILSLFGPSGCRLSKELE